MRHLSAWGLVGLLWVVALLNYLDRQVLFSIFPLLREDLHLSDAQLGLLSAAFLWVYSFASPLAGYIGDRFGYRKVIIVSLILWSGITLITGLARSFGEIFTARALMGLSEACYLPAALALIASRHSEATRSTAISIHQSGIYVGIVLGGAGGAWIGETYGWRTVFYLLGFLGLVYGLFLMKALDWTEVKTEYKPQDFWKNVGGVLRSPGFLPVLFAFVAFSLCTWVVYTWLPLLLYEKFSLDLTSAGFAATFYIQGAGLIGILLGGRLADIWTQKSDRARVITQIIGLFAAAPFLILSGFAETPLLLYVALVVFGLGRGVYDSNIMPVLCRLVTDSQRATGYGILNFLGTFVSGLAVFLGGVVKSTIGLAGVLEIAGGILLLAAFLLYRVPHAIPAKTDV